MKCILFKYIPKRYDNLCTKNQKSRNRAYNNFGFTLNFEPFYNGILQKIKLIKKFNPSRKYFFAYLPIKEFLHPNAEIDNLKLKETFEFWINCIIKSEGLELRNDLVKSENNMYYFFENEEDIKENDNLIILGNFNTNIFIRSKGNDSLIKISELIKSREEIEQSAECPKCGDKLLIENYYNNNDHKAIVSCQNLECDYEKIIDKIDLANNRNVEEKDTYSVTSCMVCNCFYFATRFPSFCSKNCHIEWEKDCYYYDKDECQPEGANPWD